MTLRSALRLCGSFLNGVLMRTGRAQVGLVSAGVAFFAMFAIFPAMAAIIAIFSLWADPVVIEQQLDLLVEIIPPQAFDLFRERIAALLAAGRYNLTSASVVSLLVAVWSARSGVAALIQGLSAIYGERQRGGLHHLLMALLLTWSLLVLALLALTAVIVMPVVIALLARYSSIADSTVNFLYLTRWITALTVMLLGLGILYRYGPHREHGRAPWITPGALVAIALWFAASYGFSIYLANFAHYNEVYGSIGAVIAVMMWLYLSAFVVLLGGVVNAEWAARRR